MGLVNTIIAKLRPVKLTLPPPMPGRDHAPALIKNFEDLRLEAYLDGGGVATIGYGSTKGVKLGMVITEAQANNLFLRDLQEHTELLNKVLASTKFVCNTHQYAALTSFCFNLGPRNVKLLLEHRNHQQVSEAILLYCKDNGKAVRGLKIRRAVEQALFNLPLEQTHTWDVVKARAEATARIK